MDPDLEQNLVTLAEMAHRLLAHIEIADALIAALIANHPDPAAVRDAWREMTSNASASMLMDSAASGRSSAYRDQTHAMIERWNHVLDGICAEDDD